MALKPNAIAFIGLCNEYCNCLETAREIERSEFIDTMVKLLPRLYITANDIQVLGFEDDGFIDPALDEDYYDSIRRGVEELLGEDDVYLEVFEEDMKYSDTPIGASIAEGLADIFQSLFNFLAMVRDATDEMTDLALSAVKDDFRMYWSQTLCNVLRPINHLAQQRSLDNDF